MSEGQEFEQSTLEELAATKFRELSEAEKKLLRAAATGGQAYCGPDGKGPSAPENAPAQASSWGSERHIRGELVAWLCADREAREPVHARGLTVACAKIVDKVDLSAMRVLFPLLFFQCHFCEEIRLLYCDLFFLSLDRCVLRQMGSVGAALLGDSLRSRAINLRGTVVNGELNLRAAEIAGNLECDGSHVVNPTGCAVSLNAARIGGSVFLRSDLTAEGEVNLAGAEIGLGLDCSRARFAKPGGMAFSADDARIGRKADLSCVQVTGRMSFVATEIGSDLALDNADFENSELRVQRARINGGLFMRGTRFGKNGFLDLSGAAAGALDADPKSWPKHNNLDMDGFTYNYLRTPDDALSFLDVLRRQHVVKAGHDKNQRVRVHPYRQLAKTLREMGYEREARKTLIALEQERDRCELFGWWLKMLRHSYRLGLRYGYEPHKPAAMIAFLLFLAGWFFMSVATRSNLMVPASNRSQPSVAARAELSPMLYSLDVLLPIHAFRQADTWWPRAEDWRWCFSWPITPPLGYLLRLWLCIEILGGWICTGLIVAGLTGIVRRE